MPGGGNFERDLKIEDNGDINPTGSLGAFAKGDVENPQGTPVHLHIWVIQMHEGMLGAFLQSPGMVDPKASNMWVTRKPDKIHGVDLQGGPVIIDPITGKKVEFELIHRHGKFRPGQAFASAVAMLDPADQLDPTRKIDWWSTTLQLS